MTKADPAQFFHTADSFELLTIAEAAQLLNISQTGMRRLQQSRRIRFYRVGCSVRFARSDLASYLSKNRVESVS